MLIVALLASACEETPSPPAEMHESAVLITIDTFRADAFGAGGHPRIRSPNLDRFFRKSVQFSEAFASAATTLASHTSILSGGWPTRHGVLRNRVQVPDEVVTLPELLRDAGFATAAFVSSVALDPRLNLTQGFDVYDFQPTRTVEMEQPWRAGGRTLRRARAWWDRADGRRFLWVHLFEPHFPYEPPGAVVESYDPGYTGTVQGDMETIFDFWAHPEEFSEEDAQHLRAMYWAEISALDRKLGAFLGELGADPSTAVVLTSDHGESLGEHDLYFKHGPHVYPGDVGVPLAVRARGLTPGVVSSMVRTIDIPAAALSLTGVVGELPEEAGNLLHRLDGSPGLPAFAIASIPWVDPPKRARGLLQRGVRTERFSYVETPLSSRMEWFDRQLDPGELQAVEPLDEEALSALEAALGSWVSEAGGSSRPAAAPELVEQLEALGYVQ